MRRMVGAVILVIALGSATVVSWLSRGPHSSVPVVSPAKLVDTTVSDSTRRARGRASISPARFALQPLAFLSSAPAESLDALPGIGPVLATRLIDARRAHGPFRSWDEVERVRGIGPKTIERLKALASRP